MADLILHHFEGSPFSEKVRLILGYKQLPWKSVIVPAIMPKPDVVTLTGGYRKTPFLQIGADIYCDTALICDVLENLHPSPTLYPQACGSLARVVAQWADSSLFWAAVTFNRGPKGTGSKFGGASGEFAQALFDDRKAMGFDLEWVRPADAATPYQAYLQRLSGMLQHQPYLLGDKPCIADFCAYHPLWLAHVRSPAVMDLLKPMPALTGWLDRMQGIGHGRSVQIDSAMAIDAAAKAQPAMHGEGPLPTADFHDEHGIALGSSVTIMAESFGREPSSGVLVAATATHFSLRRTDGRAGTVHVHFPRIGYVLKKT
jgi:glutathione S-transferase